MIFGFYLMALTLMPCGDVVDKTASEISSYSSHRDDKGPDHCTQELCAPFCSCNCCSIGKSIPVQYRKTLNVQLVRVCYKSFTIPATIQQPIDVWQPPKLA